MQDIPKAPIVVTIFFGANDAAIFGRTSERQHVPLDEYKDNLKKMVNHLKVLTPFFTARNLFEHTVLIFILKI